MTAKLKHFLHSQQFNTLSTLFLISAYLVFLYNHLVALKAGAISGSIIVFILMETLVILLLLLRTTPKQRTTEPIAWIYTLAGTFFPLVLLPSGTSLSISLGNALMIAGGILAILAYLSLNRSFGLAPALREVKTRGLYTYIRHPMYASYFIIYTGYLLLAFSVYNIILIIVLFFLLYKRAECEEKVLRTDKGYVTYAEKVPHRFFPGLL